MRVVNKSITLKDGSTLVPGGNRELVRKGTLVRFRKGRASIMRVDTVEEDAHGFRLTGMNIYGESHAAYAHDCLPVTGQDLEAWQSYKPDRYGSFLQTEEGR